MNKLSRLTYCKGVTLIEVMVFVVVVSIAFGAMMSVFTSNITKSVDPIERIKALETGQALLDEILSRRFDENSPVGGIPACGSAFGDPCSGIVADADYDDVGDYNGYNSVSDGYNLSVSVAEAGAELGLVNANARRIVVSVTTPSALTISLSAYRVNF